MIDSSPERLIQHPAIPMAKYGKKPAGYGGGNLFRLIWAPSRLVMLAGKPPYTIGMYAPYRGMAPLHPLNPCDVWIIEKWLPPTEITDKSKAQWNSDPSCLLLGPYPSKGDYCLAASPLAVNPDQANIDKLVAWIQNRKSAAENGAFIKEQMEKEIQGRRTKSQDIIKNRMLESGGEAIVGYGGGRGTKTIGMKYTANDLNLPVTPGQFGRLRGPAPVFEIPNAGGE